MREKRNHHDKSHDESQAAAESIRDALYKQGKALYGDAVKSFWFYDGELCPGCLQNSIGPINFKGKKDALALNAFIYRPRGVLIGYFLCETCAVYIFDEAQKHPHQQTPLHAEIESNLAAAYHKHLASLDA